MTIKSKDMQVFEILDKIENIVDEGNKVEYLVENFSDHKPLQYILKWNFCDTVRSVIPDGTPPYNTEEQDGPSRSSLWSYLSVFPVFVVSQQSQKMPALKREQIFIEMLESLDNKEAEMICLVKDKALTERWNISLDVVQKAFPSLSITTQREYVVKEKTPEEKAEALLDQASQLKEKAKELNAEARRLTTEAKQLASAS